MSRNNGMKFTEGGLLPLISLYKPTGLLCTRQREHLKHREPGLAQDHTAGRQWNWALGRESEHPDLPAQAPECREHSSVPAPRWESVWRGPEEAERRPDVH